MVFLAGHWEAIWPLLRHLKHLMFDFFSLEFEVKGVEVDMLKSLVSLFWYSLKD